MSSPLEQLKGLKENEPLAPYTTFKIGGPAKYFFVAGTSEEIVKAVEVANKSKIPFYILGGGSNLLVSDDGFDGLVIKTQNIKLKIQNTKIIAEGGALLSAAVGKAVEAGLAGLEWAAGIYGTIGGAVRGNAGAFGHSISEAVEEVQSMKYEVRSMKEEGIIMKLKNKECKFGYRDSVFKQDKSLIILEVVLKLKKGDMEKSREEMLKILKQRKEKQPLKYPSAGSIFKNYEVGSMNYEELKKKLPGASEENLRKWLEQKKIPAAWLIEEVNLKGKAIGGAKVSDEHGNFIINTGKATASDVLALISLIKMKVRDDLGIQLEEEIEYLGS